MAVAYDTANNAANFGFERHPSISGQDWTLSTISALQPDDLVVMLVGADRTGIIDRTRNVSTHGWTEAIYEDSVTGASHSWSEGAVYWKTYASGALQHSSLGARGMAAIAGRITGADTGAPIDVAGSAEGYSNTATCPSITTTTADCLILVGVTHDDEVELPTAAPAGCTMIHALFSDTSGCGTALAVVDALKATPGATGAFVWDLTGTGSENWSTFTVAIKPATGGAGAEVTPLGVSPASTATAPTVNQGPVDVAPGGVGSNPPAVGTPGIDQTTAITATGVSSRPALATPSTAQPAVSVSPVGVSSAPTAGTATIGDAGTSPVAPIAVASQPTFGDPEVSQAAIVVSPAGTATLRPAVGAPILLNTWQLVFLGISAPSPGVGSPAVLQPFVPSAESIEETVISIIKICNLALTRIGAQSIASLTEASAAAVHCKLLYAPQRDSLLRMVPWRFATQRQALALLSEDPPPQWRYVYQLPSDFLAARYVEPSGGVPWSADTGGQAQSPIASLPSVATPRFEVWGRKLATNQSDAVLIYTARTEDPTQFDPLFVEALSHRLAAELAMPLQSDRDTRNLMMRDFRLLMSSAMAANSRDAPVRIDQAADWISGRA